MPTWGDILAEGNATLTAEGAIDWDRVRRKYLTQLASQTGRSTIIYATDFMSAGAPPQLVTINLTDVQALMEVMKGLPGPELDLILHTPGGSPEDLESVVRYVRTKFDHIRAFVPLAAMSAGTMWALACDEIIMGKHSQLGPIDPQFALAFGEQIRLAPAQAILDQFEHAMEECRNDPASVAGWITVMRGYGTSLLEECRRAQDLSVSLVSQWLTEGMCRNEPDPEAQAKDIASKFADYETHYSHGRPIGRDKAREYGVHVTDLEDDQGLQDAVLSVHHAGLHTLGGTMAVKLVESHLPRTFAILGGQVQVVQNPPAGGGAGRKSGQQPQPSRPRPPTGSKKNKRRRR